MEDGNRDGRISLDDAVAIVNAKSVELQLDGGQFKMTPFQQQVIGALINALGSPSK
jgi:hypothetical protein